MVKGKRNKLASSVTSVLSNYDLLVEILLRLPVLSLVLFKSVSKNWLSIIKSPDFILRHRTQNPNIDPSFGLFIHGPYVPRERPQYKFESFDIRIPSQRFSLPLGGVEIWQSCNGLLLCQAFPYNYNNRLYVYNPTSKLFKTLPGKSSEYFCARMGFDPAKSPHYTVIKLDENYRYNFTTQLHLYSSETGFWSECGDPFSKFIFFGFEEGVYWNDAFHWLNTTYKDGKTLHYKLVIVNEQPILTKLQLPLTFDGKSHFQSKLFESRGCLLLLGKDHAHSQHLNVFEMRVDDSEWLVKFTFNVDDFMMPLPSTWSIRLCVWSIVLGEKEEDSFMIVDLLTTLYNTTPSQRLSERSLIWNQQALVLWFLFLTLSSALRLLLKSSSAFCFWSSI